MIVNPDGTSVDDNRLLLRAEHEICYSAKRAIEMYIPVWEKQPCDSLFGICADAFVLSDGERKQCLDLMREFGMLEIKEEGEANEE